MGPPGPARDRGPGRGEAEPGDDDRVGRGRRQGDRAGQQLPIIHLVSCVQYKMSPERPGDCTDHISFRSFLFHFGQVVSWFSYRLEKRRKKENVFRQGKVREFCSRCGKNKRILLQKYWKRWNFSHFFFLWSWSPTYGKSWIRHWGGTTSVNNFSVIFRGKL